MEVKLDRASSMPRFSTLRMTFNGLSAEMMKKHVNKSVICIVKYRYTRVWSLRMYKCVGELL